MVKVTFIFASADQIVALAQVADATQPSEVGVKVGSALFFQKQTDEIKSKKIAPLKQLVSCEDTATATRQQRSNQSEAPIGRENAVLLLRIAGPTFNLGPRPS